MAYGQDTTFVPNEKDTRANLIAELKSVKIKLENNEALFNFVSDPDLTEYAIYENRALLAHYRYLIKTIKAIDSSFLTVST